MKALNARGQKNPALKKIGGHFLIGMNIHVKDMRLCKAELVAPTPGPFTVEARMEKPFGLHGSRIGPIPGENVKLGSRTRKCKKLTVNHLHGSSLKEHVQHGSWKTETKNAYVEVT